MAVPPYEDLMLPLLKAIPNDHEYHIRDVMKSVADDLRLSEEDREARHPSGDRILRNRLHWARLYLLKAGLLDAPRRGYVKITNDGRRILNQRPERINIEYLRQFPSFLEFIESSRATSQNDEGIRETGSAQQTLTLPAGQTPEEQMQAAYELLRNQLVIDLLKKIKENSPRFFEELVIDVLVKMGYGGSKADAGTAIGRSGDGGIDGIIKEDRLGLDVIYVQAKRWENTVGRPVVQAFVGSIEGRRANKGIIISTSDYSRDARDYIETIGKKIVLINGTGLARLMIEHDVGVTKEETYSISRIDSDYFEED